MAKPWFVLVVTVTVLPNRLRLAFALLTPETVDVPATVAEIAGLMATVNVKLVVVGTDTTVSAPLYSVCVAPDSVIA